MKSKPPTGLEQVEKILEKYYETCPECNGSGSIPTPIIIGGAENHYYIKCPTCRSEGRVLKEKPKAPDWTESLGEMIENVQVGFPGIKG